MLNNKQSSWVSRLILIAAGLYLILCAQHYFNQRPLWRDEYAVFLNLKSFSPDVLLNQRLLLYQVFPRMYLILIKGAAQMFHYNLLGLRLLPFVCMNAAFFVWLAIARRENLRPLLYLLFVLSWAASSQMIYYSAELKQYSLDVLAVALIVFFICRQAGQENGRENREGPRDSAVLFFLPLLGLVSYPAMVAMFIPFYNLVVRVIKEKKGLGRMVVYAGLMVLVVVFSYLFDMRLRPVRDVTSGFGDYFISFASVGEFFKTFGEGVNNLFSRWFAERPKIIRAVARGFVIFGLAQMFYGFFTNFKKDGFYLHSTKTIMLALFLGLCVLGALRKYPFVVPRTALFFCPFVLLSTVRGIGLLGKIHRRIPGVVYALYAVFLLGVSFGLARLIFSGDLGAIPVLW